METINTKTNTGYIVGIKGSSYHAFMGKTEIPTQTDSYGRPYRICLLKLRLGERKLWLDWKLPPQGHYKRLVSAWWHDHTPFPVYYERYSRDCDMVEATWFERHPNGWTARAARQNAYEYAEGLEEFRPISRAAYKRNMGVVHKRDLVAEQMNY